jgi:hypothetical protein
MSYLDTSKDILNLALALSVFGLAFLMGWILVYVIMMIRRLLNIFTGVEQSLKKVEEFLGTAREKLDHSSSYLAMLATGARELVAYFMSKRASSTGGKKKKNADF